MVLCRCAKAPVQTCREKAASTSDALEAVQLCRRIHESQPRPEAWRGWNHHLCGGGQGVQRPCSCPGSLCTGNIPFSVAF